MSLERISQYQLVVNAADLMLDYEARRSTADGLRRALVHDFSDGLTINWAADYPGGVTINGAVKVPATLTVAGKDVGSALADMQAKITQLEARVAALEAGG